MNESKKDSLLRKIKSLLELSKDENSTHEAETAAKMAQQLMMKYNIEEAEIHGHEPSSLERSLYPVYKIMKGNEGTWIRSMFSTIAKFNFCSIVITEKYVTDQYEEHFYILGSPTNIEMVTYIAEQLISRIRGIEKLYWERYTGRDKRNTFRRGFFKGAVNGIYVKLEAQQEQFTEDDSTNALIVRKDKELEEFKHKIFGKLGKSRSGGSSSRDGRSQGYEAGSNMSINQGVRGRNGSLQLGGN